MLVYWAKKVVPTNLPAPKVRLQPWDQSQPFAVVDWYKYWGNTTWGQYKLFNYPEVITVDLTDEQIAKWVRVEMMVYNRGKSQYTIATNEDAGYKIPTSWIGWVNTLGNLDTRWWAQQFVSAWSLAVDRPNHYQVTDRNQVIPVREYLNNRMSQVDIVYRDTSWTTQYSGCLTVAQWMRNAGSNKPWNKFWYSPWYRPLYFAFRYIMKADDWYSYISWPLTRVIKLTQEKHPFNYNADASNILGAPANVINPLADRSVARCRFETRLP